MARGKDPAPFLARAAKTIRAIPRGQVLSYGQVAAIAGDPFHARTVVRVLKLVPGLPWWRVIRGDGTLAPQVAGAQAKLLRKDGVTVVGRKVVLNPRGKAR